MIFQKGQQATIKQPDTEIHFGKGNSLDEIIVIELFGEEFRFKPDKQVENPKQIAQYIKKHIKDAEELFQHKTSGKNKIAILLLAAMNISKDFHELKVQHSELEQEIYKKLSSLNEKIDKGIL